LNWMISDFGRFNLPKVEPARMEYMIYPQRVDPETKTLPQPLMGQLTRELGRPPTIEEVQAREVANRSAMRTRAGAILQRSSFDEDQPVAPQQEAKAQSPVFDGGKPQAKVQPNQAGGLAPQAANQVDTKRDPNGPLLRGGVKRAVVMLRPEEKGVEEVKVEGTSQASIHQIIEQERANAEVGIAPPIAAGK